MARRAESMFEHTVERVRGWQPQRQVIALAMLGFVLALIFGGLYLSQVVNEATTNRRLETLLDERDDLERENEGLRVEIARLKSVPALIARAETMGYGVASPEAIEYLVVEDYRPQRVDTVAPLETEVEDTPDIYDETFADWIGRQWHNFQQGIEGVFGG